MSGDPMTADDILARWGETFWFRDPEWVEYLRGMCSPVVSVADGYVNIRDEGSYRSLGFPEDDD